MYSKIVFVLLFIPLWTWGAVPAAVNDTTPEALYSLGLNYLTGNDSLGIYMNKEKSVELIRRAAEQGDADTQYKLGVCYAKGLGVVQDSEQAEYWKNLAIQNGYEP